MKKVDFSEPLFFLNILGMDPFKSNKLATLRTLFTIVVYFLTISSGILEIIFHSEGIKTYARASDTMIPMCQLSFKIAALIIYKKKIGQLVISSQQFWPLQKFGPTYEKILGKTHFWSKRIFTAYRRLMAFTCFQFMVVKIVFKLKKPVTISFGENEEYSVVYDRCYLILHFFITFLSVNVLSGFDGFFFYSIAHCITELRMVKIAFGVHKIEAKCTNRERLRAAVKHHDQALKFISNFNEICSIVLLVQQLTCLFGMCAGLFFISKDGMPPNLDRLAKYTPYISTLILQTLIFCFAGHLLSVLSLDIPNAIFYSDWTQSFVYKSRVDRIIAMQRGQKAAILTLGSFGSLDLNSFKLVMQKTYSFFAFINTMMNK